MLLFFEVWEAIDTESVALGCDAEGDGAFGLWMRRDRPTSERSHFSLGLGHARQLGAPSLLKGYLSFRLLFEFRLFVIQFLQLLQNATEVFLQVGF